MSNNADTSATSDVKNQLNNRSQSSGDYFKTYLKRVQSGDLGSIPIILGLAAIMIIFQSLNQNFLTARNFVNLIVQMAGVTAIAYGVVFVLLLGEIDLSIGYVSAVGAVSMTLLLKDPNGWPWYAATITALLITAAIGFLHGIIITRFQIPSFVVTLAGLLAWNGVVLILMGGAGTVIIQDKVIIGVANFFLSPVWGWVIVFSFVAGYALFELWQVFTRKQRGLTSKPITAVLLQLVILSALAAIAVSVANHDRGVPLVGIILVIFLVGFSFIAYRTRFGRYVYALGGNKEAARRAGIPVEWIKVQVFMISSTMAGVGGIILASRLRSVDTASGGGNLLLNAIAAAVIGGTSLFGGSGRVSSAMLGALIIASVENGMGLLGLSAGIKFVVTGLVLLLAVLVDAVSRRGRQQSGLA